MAQAKSKYKVFLPAARLGRSEPIENDEQTQAENAADLPKAFDDNVHGHAMKIETRNGIGFNPKTEAIQGAVVQMGDRNLVTSVSTAAIECDGQKFMSISSASPIYSAIEGKTAEENCTFNRRTITIGAVC